MTEARKLTEVGIAQAIEFLDRVRDDLNSSLEVPENILFGEATSQAMPNAPTVEHRRFTTRRDAAEYLSELTPALSENHIDNWGFWSWLGLYHFSDIIFDKNRHERFAKSTIGRGTTINERIVVDPSSSESKRSSSRHYLRLAWLVNWKYGELCALTLNEDIMSLPTITQEIVDSLRVFNSVGVVPVVLKLYSEDNKQKRGFRGNTPGNIYHFFHVLDQLECTHDIYGMSSEALMSILPPEFDQWKPQGERT